MGFYLVFAESVYAAGLSWLWNRNSAPSPNDLMLCLTLVDVRNNPCRVNLQKAAEPDNMVNIQRMCNWQMHSLTS